MVLAVTNGLGNVSHADVSSGGEAPLDVHFVGDVRDGSVVADRSHHSVRIHNPLAPEIFGERVTRRRSRLRDLLAWHVGAVLWFDAQRESKNDEARAASYQDEYGDSDSE